MAEKYPESAVAFAAATQALPASEDLVVARFKLADALFQQTNYAGALENYRAALQAMTNWPAANAELRLPALYQSLRASLALTNFASAEEAVREILHSDPKDSDGRAQSAAGGARACGCQSASGSPAVVRGVREAVSPIRIASPGRTADRPRARAAVRLDECHRGL